MLTLLPGASTVCHRVYAILVQIDTFVYSLSAVLLAGLWLTKCSCARVMCVCLAVSMCVCLTEISQKLRNEIFWKDGMAQEPMIRLWWQSNSPFLYLAPNCYCLNGFLTRKQYFRSLCQMASL